MSTLQALIYGFVQGVAEYLPISSSAHLILFPRFMGAVEMGLAFDVFLHCGTLMATLAFYRKDWVRILRSFPKGEAWRWLAVATVPALVFGALLNSFIKSSLRGNEVIAVSLFVGGWLLYLSDRYFKSDSPLNSVNLKRGFYLGLFQCLALIPGMSRSGSTMVGARVLGFPRAEAARISFLMSAPVTLAAVAFELRHFQELFEGPSEVTPLLIALVSTFLFGSLSIGFLIQFLKRFSFLSFAVYRTILSAAILLLLK